MSEGLGFGVAFTDQIPVPRAIGAPVDRPMGYMALIDNETGQHFSALVEPEYAAMMVEAALISGESLGTEQAVRWTCLGWPDDWMYLLPTLPKWVQVYEPGAPL